ncbi:MAG: hypothetical protein KatS3mg002_0369 [Candidatus Woesearchaeota archaeon]|nr:MAG: hypothetical protein KatS3mg002_0369 [Candidatus Woesearchaeota archaeon]
MILQRSPNVRFGNYWEFIKGKLKFSETFIKCLEREVFEEIGLKLDLSSYKKCFMGRLKLNDSYFLYTYVITISEDFNIQLSEEHITYYWLSYNELEKYQIDPLLKPIIKKIFEESEYLHKCLQQ